MVFLGDELVNRITAGVGVNESHDLECVKHTIDLEGLVGNVVGEGHSVGARRVTLIGTRWIIRSLLVVKPKSERRIG